jgi:uncharacterized protein YbjQ (UPF0145 family)
MGFSDRMNAKSYRGRCIACSNTDLETKKSIAEGQCAEKIQLEREASSQKEVAISAVVLTTETAPNLNIIERIEIVTAECAYGMNIFKDLFAGVRDIVGGRSEAVQKTMRDARRTVLYELKKEAHTVGANAVVGVDLEYVELSAAGSMVMLVASGTAVIIED